MPQPARHAARIAVVIPLYGQAQFLVETVVSVLRQTQPSVVAVIVNDGCPDPASHEAGRSLALAHPQQVVYLHQRNRGLSGARNTGIRYALAAFPDLQGIFLLDSDNYLDGHALQRLLARLDADPTIDWVSPHLQMFGAVNRPWSLVDRFTRFRQLFENQADAAALFRPEVFRTGATYDELMRHGYEDWELYLDQLLAGRRGATEPTAIMFYRSRPGSMLADATQRHETIRRYMRTKHRRWYLPRGRTLLEHDDLPRYAFVDEFGRVQLFTDPMQPPRQLRAGESYRAAITIVGARGVFEELRRSRMLPGLLFVAQPEHVSAATAIVVGRGPSLSIERAAIRSGAAASLLVVPTTLLDDLAPTGQSAALPGGQTPDTTDEQGAPETTDERVARALLGATEFVVQLESPSWALPQGWDDIELLELVARARRRIAPESAEERTDPTRGYVSNTDFAGHLHQEVVESTYPLAEDGHRHLGFAMPWLKLGGVEHCVLQVTKALRRLDPSLRIHLALTQSGVIDTSPDLTTEVFDSITSFSDLEWDRRLAMVDRWSSAMDVTVNAHSEAAFEALEHRAEWPPSERHTLNSAYLHVLDLTPDGMRLGWPIVASQHESAIDNYLVISRRMAALMLNEGVPQRKITIGPNAPVIRPQQRSDAEALADAKADRLAAGGQLRVLIAGRLDFQKGGRRAAHAIRKLVASGRDVHVTVLGAPTLDAELPEFPAGVCTWRAATNDADELSAAFAEADVLLLLSRWEGVPLAMLDAMAHGTLVVATDVGAITEVVSHRDTAYLIPAVATDDDEVLGAHAATILAELIDDATGGRAMRRRAVQQAWSMTWDTTANQILELVAQSWKVQHT